MHRWFFANEHEECEPRPEEEVPRDVDVDKTDIKEPEKDIVYTDWPFCVSVKKPLQGNEYVAITGNCDVLGNWAPNNVFLMNPSNCNCMTQCVCLKFEATVRIPRNKDIEYRYCIVGYDPLLDDVIIRFWEVMPTPRIIRTCHNMLRICEKFGQTDAGHHVDRGWATNDTYVQFKIFNAPFIWLQQTPRLIHVHLQPMYETEPPLCGVKFLEPLRLSTGHSVTSHRRISVPPNELNVHLAYTEVANLRHTKSLQFQPPDGVRCGPEDMQLYHCSVRHPLETLYRLDLYTFAHKAAPDEPPYHYGYGFVQPAQLVGSEGQLRIKITCASTHRSLIELSLRYLIIRPVPSLSCDLSRSYERHWRRNRKALDIGHRGTGVTYRLGEDVHRENTVFAFKRAAVNYADLIELDVQLTRDAQVVVYHDHALKFSLSSAWGVEKLLSGQDVFVFPHEQLSRIRLLALNGAKRGDHILLPLSALSHEELRLAQPLRFTAAGGCDPDCERYLRDQLPFPLLGDLFDLPERMGFNIELKWTQRDCRGRWQDNGFRPAFDRNFYVDTVLEVVFRLAGKRRIFFSSFDADICVMLRFKQNLYPVLLLLDNPERPVRFLDERVNQLDNGARLAHNMELFGVNLHAGTLLKQPFILGLIRDLQMQVFAWGTPLNSAAVRDKLKFYGVVGVTFDRIDQRDQIGAELQGVVCLIDSPATRNHIRRLQVAERLLKCARR